MNAIALSPGLLIQMAESEELTEYHALTKFSVAVRALFYTYVLSPTMSLEDRAKVTGLSLNHVTVFSCTDMFTNKVLAVMESTTKLAQAEADYRRTTLGNALLRQIEKDLAEDTDIPLATKMLYLQQLAGSAPNPRAGGVKIAINNSNSPEPPTSQVGAAPSAVVERARAMIQGIGK